MSEGYIRIQRKVALELLKRDVNAFLLLMLQALEARWHDDPNPDNLQVGESLMGLEYINKIFGWSEQRYREVKKRNGLKYKKATYKGTELGTIGKFIDNSFCMLFDEDHNGLNNGLNNGPVENQQRTNNGLTTDLQRLTKKEEGRKKKEVASLSKDNSATSPPQPPKGEKREGGGKMGYKHDGPISEEAYKLSEETVGMKITCSADRIQQWIEELDGRTDLVEQEIRDVGHLKASGTKIITAPGFIGFRIANIKSSFRPTLERRTETNRQYAEKEFGVFELEGYQRIDYGVDFITVKHLKERFQIFYASATFQEEVKEMINYLNKHKKKIIGLKEA